MLSVLKASGPLAGIVFMCLGMAMFSFNDALGKWLLGSYSVGMVLLIRSCAALAVLLPMATARGEIGAVLRPPHPRWQILRVVLTTFEATCFYWAVTYMPLADTVAFWLATPIYVAMLARPLLGEPTPLRRWIAIGVGFVGVLFALNPAGDNLGLPALAALAGSFAFALCMIVTRTLRGTPDVTLVTWQTVAALLLGAVWVFADWLLVRLGRVPEHAGLVMPTLPDFGLLILIGIVAMAAHMFTNRSLKLAPASVVVPYQYTLILWAVLLGWAVWGDVPGLNTVIGVAIIIAAGVWIFWDEARAGQETLAEAEEMRE